MNKRKNYIFSIAVLLLNACSLALATQQEPDQITFTKVAAPASGQHGFVTSKPTTVVEYPLRDHLAKVYPRSPFDFGNSSNRKRYRACWDVRAGKLYLSAFSAKIDGKPVDIGGVFPKQKLPVFAHWYTGKLRVLVDSSGHPYYGHTFPKARVLTVEKGVVIEDMEILNFKVEYPGSRAKAM